MARKLPWKTQGDNLTVAPKPKPKKAPASKPGAKQTRKSEPGASDDNHDYDRAGRSKKASKPKEHQGDRRSLSTSPPPEAPGERFMDEGIQYDDQYRMVEDEFLAVAQKFTMHLHAAEYKRQTKAVRANRADAITSISRPVTGRMPDQSKRKAQSIMQSKAQSSAIHGLLPKKAASADDTDESDESVELPYVGTTLHGLMDSPRKKAVSLTHFGATRTSTRAAAGFRQPIGQSRNFESFGSESPKSKVQARVIKAPNNKVASSTESEDYDEDEEL